MAKHLVLAGGGHAHLETLARLSGPRGLTARGHLVTLVSPSPFQAYSGMGPGVLGGRYRFEDILFPVRRMAESGGASFIEAAVADIDPDRRLLFLSDGRELAYDAVSFNIGSETPERGLFGPGPRPEGVHAVKPIANLARAALDIRARVAAGEAPRVLVAGGGAAGFEVAGNAHGLLSSLGVGNPEVTIVVGRGLLSDLPERVGRRAAASLARRGIRVVPGRVERFETGRALLSGDRLAAFDLALVATGARPPDLFVRRGLALDTTGAVRGPGGPDATGATGGLAVNAFLQNPLYPELFGGGDCIHFLPRPLDKVGVYAVRQGPVLADNPQAFLEGGALRPFVGTRGGYLRILSRGDGGAILVKGGFVWSGRAAMWFKDVLDRRFMSRYRPALRP